MVDSFFVNPAKRKRSAPRASTAPRKNRPAATRPRAEPADAESVTDSEIVEDSDSDMSVDDDDEPISEEDADEDVDETEADKRRRLAKQYLENLESELQAKDGLGDENAFDAQDLDREIIGRRLREDVAETQGKVYRFLADALDFSRTSPDNKTTKLIQAKAYGLTAVSYRHPYAYTTSKDLTVTKWDVTNPLRPRPVRYVRGNRRIGADERESFKGHFDEILCVAASPDGKYVVTGGRDKRIVVWSAENLAPVKVFETKDRKGVVLGLVFRRSTSELYAACADLKLRTFNLDQLAQIEILFGHQDEVADIAALAQERCVSVGSRDRSAIVWKIAEESRLTYRGADSAANKNAPGKILEGSIDCVSMLDDQLFVTGGDTGNVCLWQTTKKKPLFVHREAHGRDEPLAPELASADRTDGRIPAGPAPQPRYITSICAVPYSDLFFTGSWSGDIKVWKLSEDQRSFKPVGSIAGAAGIVNRISVDDSDKRPLTIVAAMAKEPRLGRWLKVRGTNGLFTAVVNPK